MAYPNINAKFHLAAAGAKVVMTGKLAWAELDVEKTRVFAFVTQDPDAAEGRPADENAPPPENTATARGDEEFPNGQIRWEIEAVTHGDSPQFIKGWAWATAVGVNFTKDGQLTTYTWSRWVFLTENPVAEVG